MVGSTDDPSVFSLPDSKLPGDKEFVSWQQDLEDSVKPTQQARPTVIRWSEGGKEVFISGSFNNWSTKIPLIKSHNDFVAILDLPEGEHQYKFFVDGQWVHDPSECDPALLPEPNHVMLNHLYALSIKDSVMVLSATHRYKKKYVTTLLYKPI
ncbi:5'-AMP-activated protein kinase subunit beta-2 [Tupaia chinensis]|uniref:5'-AMP-activated protein kinase subunit beta-2 n=1 Tax=Tupaia chinensis TaxID=246437 RepID=L8Y9B7_TUPCH|nr:5'-AMP-activated protein kinase subunit beta-2 [Tupaia chinensis]